MDAMHRISNPFLMPRMLRVGILSRKDKMSEMNGHENRTSDQSGFSYHGKSDFVSVCGIQLSRVVPSNTGIF